MYRPNEIDDMKIPIKVYKRTKVYVLGKPKFENVEINDPIVMCNFKSYGGTEREDNGMIVIRDTATVTTWFRPDITSDCVIEHLQTGKMYEIQNEPENFGMRNQYMQFKVERINPNV